MIGDLCKVTFLCLLILIPIAQGLQGDWVKEGVRVSDGSVPFVIILPDGRFRLYYCSVSGIVSAISSDGLSFTREPGVRLQGTGRTGDPEPIVCDPSVLRLDDGRWRMYYKGADRPGGPGFANHRAFSAISEDGLTFQREGLRYDPVGTIDNGWASVPEVIRTFDGRFRMYYVTGAAPPNDGIASAISNDGLTFTRENGVRARGVDPAIIKLPNGTYWLFFKEQLGQEPGIYSARSTNGLDFTVDPGVRVTPSPTADRNVFDPTVIVLPDGSARMYYGGATDSGVITFSAKFNPPTPIPEFRTMFVVLLFSLLFAALRTKNQLRHS